MWIVLGVILIAGMMLFAYFSNKQASRNEERRERFQQKQEELIELLRKREAEQNEHKDD